MSLIDDAKAKMNETKGKIEQKMNDSDIDDKAKAKMDEMRSHGKKDSDQSSSKKM